MDKKDLYAQIEKTLNQALELTKKSIKIASEKAGEAVHVSKLMIEKATLEHRLGQKFAKLGNCIYQKVSGNAGELSCDDPEIKRLIEETRGLEAELGRVEAEVKAATAALKTDKTKS